MRAAAPPAGFAIVALRSGVVEYASRDHAAKPLCGDAFAGGTALGSWIDHDADGVLRLVVRVTSHADARRAFGKATVPYGR